MKAKTIEKVLNTKIEKWLKTITDANTQALARHNTIVTGGSIASMLLNEQVNDYDVYFRNRETAFAVAKYYADKTDGRVGLDGSATDRVKLNFLGEDFYSVTGEGSLMAEPDEPKLPTSMFGEINTARAAVESDTYTALFFSPNAITLSDNVQLVLRFYGEPAELHENYDYVHATSYYDHQDQRLTIPKAALESLLTKELRYIGSLYPVTSVIRSKKFIKRGWSITAGEYLKMLFQVAELDLKDPEVLQSQLVGVDIGYFSIMIEALNNRDASIHPVVTYNYICELIDRIFN